MQTVSQVHQFQVGQIRCAVLHEGGGEILAENVPTSYPNVAAEAVIEALRGAATLRNSLNPLYVETASERLLVDVGFGVQRRPAMGNLIGSLSMIDRTPADISVIFLSHFHGDHIIGLFDEDGERLYPHARYVAHQAEWEEWLPRWQQSSDAADQVRARLMLSLGADVTLVGDGDPIIEGVTVVAAPGHTLGHSGVLVESNGERLIDLVDLLHRVPQFAYPEWHFVWDSDAVMGAASRRALLRRCADEQLLTVFYHLPFPGLGYVLQDGSAFAWEPLGER